MGHDHIKLYSDSRILPLILFGKLINISMNIFKITLLGSLIVLNSCNKQTKAEKADERKKIDEVYSEFEAINEQSKKKIEEDAFVEWEEVYTNNFYGTLKSEMQRIWKEGKTVIFDVDVIGGLNLKKEFQDNALAIFVQPPSYEELEKRLRGRSTESEDKIRQRMAKARKEIGRSDRFDHILLNNDLATAKKEAESLVRLFLGK